MRYRPLGRSGLEVSELGLGTWPLGGDEYGAVDDAESMATIRAALEQGVTLLDIADVYGYGHAEELIGAALRGWRGDVVVSTKVGNDVLAVPRVPGGAGKNFSPDYLRRAAEGSLRRFGRDALDLLLLHNPPLAVIRAGEVFDTLARLREQGTLRFTGVSVYTPEEGLEAIRVGRVDALMIPFNLIAQAPRAQLFPAVAREGVALLIRTPLGEGLLSGKYAPDAAFPAGDHRRDRGVDWLRQGVRKAARLRFLERPDRTLAQAALAFVLSHPEVSAVLPGAKTRGQLAENLAAAAHAPLSHDDLQAAYRLFETDFAC